MAPNSRHDQLARPPARPLARPLVRLPARPSRSYIISVFRGGGGGGCAIVGGTIRKNVKNKGDRGAKVGLGGWKIRTVERRGMRQWWRFSQGGAMECRNWNGGVVERCPDSRTMEWWNEETSTFERGNGGTLFEFEWRSGGRLSEFARWSGGTLSRLGQRSGEMLV